MGLLGKVLESALFRVHRRNEFDSVWLRRFFEEKYGIRVGMYSYGCFDPLRVPRGTVIGRYCSFARTATIFNGNHGTGFLTTHPYVYNPSLGMVELETIERTQCSIEDDVWLGHNSVVLPSVRSVGRGAVVAAGSIVTKDVPRYSIVAGNPARVIKFRFSDNLIVEIEKSRWWELDRETLRKMIETCPDLIFNPSVERLVGCQLS